MEKPKAIELLRELVEAEIEVVHQVNSRRGLSKRAQRRERKAVEAIFHELTFPGIKLTDEEFAEISS